MRVTFGVDFTCFIWSAAAGLALAVIYDVLRLTRRLLPAPDLLVNIEDILFLILFGTASVAVAYTKNNGILRLYGVLTQAAVLGLYHLVIKDRAVSLTEAVFRLMFRGLGKLIRFIAMPFVFICRRIIIPAANHILSHLRQRQISQNNKTTK